MGDTAFIWKHSKSINFSKLGVSIEVNTQIKLVNGSDLLIGRGMGEGRPLLLQGQEKLHKAFPPHMGLKI